MRKAKSKHRARSLKPRPAVEIRAAAPPAPHTCQNTHGGNTCDTCFEPVRKRLIDGDSAHRKEYPLFEGLLAYFPDACAYVAHISKKGNDKHNPGQAMHHARSKSGDHADCIMRHLSNHGGFDEAGLRESGGVAWRAMALLQEELERDLGLPLPRGATA